MKLRYSPASPYVRKVMIVAYEGGLADRIEKVTTAVVPVKANDELKAENPLVKVPALTTDDGETLYDSPVICEYLDTQFGVGRLLPGKGDERFLVLTRAALADGLLDAGLLVRHERLRPAQQQSQDWIAWQLGKVLAALDALERDAAALEGDLDLGKIGVGCALGYLPLRVAEANDPARWPRLGRWSMKLFERPSFARTMPQL